MHDVLPSSPPAFSPLATPAPILPSPAPLPLQRNPSSMTSTSTGYLFPSQCKLLYITGLPYKGLANIRKMLGPQGLGINLRHIVNLRWVTDTILEAIVPVSHAQDVEKKIGHHPPRLSMVPGYDLLIVGNFPWPSDFNLERKQSILRRAMITRFAASYATTTSWPTKRFMTEFMQHYQWKEEFLEEVTKQMAKSSVEGTPVSPIPMNLATGYNLGQRQPSQQASPNVMLSLTKSTSSHESDSHPSCKDN